LIAALPDDLSRECVEIDRIKFSGPAFPGIGTRLMSLQLVERGLTDAARFTAGGEVVQPSQVLHRKPILVERGSLWPATKVTLAMAADGAGRRRGDHQGRAHLRLAAAAGNVNDRMRTGVRVEWPRFARDGTPSWPACNRGNIDVTIKLFRSQQVTPLRGWSRDESF
jgi:hypothetical protein